MYQTSDFRNGLKILLDGIPYEITYFQHVKPGKGGAFVRTKLRNLKNNSIIEKTFRSGEKAGKPDISQEDMQFLYQDGDFHFMNTSTYDQIAIPEDVVGDSALFLKENTVVSILMFNGEVLNIELPAFVELEVQQCDPGLKGDTVSGATKPATLETGAVVQVPLFINQGDTLKIDTRSGEYIERA
ncbi:elongation factor P [bacterium J17]|nr:elongation factor P [bacterium J17]